MGVLLPTVQKFGDYSTNVAMQLTRILRQNPRNLANLIIENLDYAAGDIERVDNWQELYEKITKYYDENKNKIVENR